MAHSNTCKNGQGKINNMLVKLNSVLHEIMPHMNDATSGIINKVGLVSIVTGGTNAVVTTAIETQDPTWLTVSSLTGVLSAIGAGVFIINVIVRAGAYLYFARRKDKREQEEHDRKLEDK